MCYRYALRPTDADLSNYCVCVCVQKLYEDKAGQAGLIELLKDSGTVDTKNHLPQKGYIQVTYVEPYFDDWELIERLTVFDRSFNIRTYTVCMNVTAHSTYVRTLCA